MITALDHVVIAVRDLGAAVETYETLLGRARSWRAEAHGGGGEIAAFGLANVAVELIAPASDGPMADRLRAVLAARGEGLASLAFAVSWSGPGGTRRGYPGPRRALESDAPPGVGEASRFYVRKVC